jgi:hypothetical protein
MIVIYGLLELLIKELESEGEDGIDRALTYPSYSPL